MQVSGALGFTQAHSASVPPGAYIGGFINVTVATDCEGPLGVLNWRSPDNSTGMRISSKYFLELLILHVEGILACPEIAVGSNSTFYQVFAKTPAFNQTDCITLAGLLPTYEPSGSPPGAWQYI